MNRAARRRAATLSRRAKAALAGVTDANARAEEIGRLAGAPLKGGNFARYDTPWSRDDESWFARNPTRTHRERLAYAGEVEQFRGQGLDARTGQTAVIVRQVRPGTRIRVAISFEPPFHPHDDEGYLRLAFDEAVAARAEGRPFDNARVGLAHAVEMPPGLA